MEEFFQHFPQAREGKPVLLVVIHCESEKQTIQNVELAKECGADGAFLINHGNFSLLL